MPRVKIVRDNRTDSLKKITTRSKTKIKTETLKKFSSAIVSKGNRTIPVPKPFLTPVSQQKQDVHMSGNKENKKKASAAGNINKEELTHHYKTVKQSTKQKGIVIYIHDNSGDSDDDDDDDGKDSKDDSDNNSRDDYEPDTEDEEEYRSRSYFW